MHTLLLKRITGLKCNRDIHSSTRHEYLIIPIFIILLLFKSATAVSCVNLNDTMPVYPVTNSIYLFQDSSGITTFNEIHDSPGTFDFKLVNKAIPNEGFSKAAHWFKIEICNQSCIERAWILDIAMPSLHNVTFYITSNKSFLDSLKTGFSIGKKAKRNSYRNPAIEFHTKPETHYTVYARIESETPVIAPFFIRERKSYIEYERTRDTMLGFYFGAVVIMALYHFYMYLSIKDKGYLWLSLFSILFIVGQMTAVYGYLSDWGVPHPGILTRWLHIINYIATFAAMVLSRTFINSAKYTPIADKVLHAIQMISIILAPLSPLFSFAFAENILLLFNIVPLPFLIFSAAISYSNGHRPGLYYILANSCFIIGLAIYNCMYGFGLLPFNMFLYFIPNITFVIMLSLYSIGLADKISTYRKAHENAQQQACQDLEAKLQLHEEKSIIERELQQAKKMELAGRLLSGVAHDIKNYLNPILGYSSIIRKQCKGNVTLLNHSQNLSIAANQLKQLTSTLLDVTRKNHQETITFDINTSIEQIISILKHSSKKNISFAISKSADSLIITGDRSKIHNAIINIGLNAVDAIERDGNITISTGTTEFEHHHAIRKKFGIEEGMYAFVSIKDTGTGMDQEVMDHLFEPYFSKKDGVGTGLGLANVYNCVTLHKGCIDITSIPGSETTVTIYFPFSVSDEQNTCIQKACDSAEFSVSIESC